MIIYPIVGVNIRMRSIQHKYTKNKETNNNNNLNQRQKLAIFVATFQSEGNLKEEHTSNILCIIINYTVLFISYSIIKD